MAHNIQKYIDIHGPTGDLAFIYRHAQNICDSWIKIKPETPLESPEQCELGILIEMLGGDPDVINSHGWSQIEMVEVDNIGLLTITCITPYGNLSEMMEWFRKRFPDCNFIVTNNDDEENEWD